MLDAFQTSLIFPGHEWQGSAEARVVAGVGEELVPLRTESGVEVMGWFGRADDGGAVRGAVLYFYGNGECMAPARDVAATFRELGYGCMLVDYAGFGMSAGEPSEEGCYEAAEAAYAHLRGRGEVDAGRVVVAGWSLGGAVAIELARRHEQELRGLMTFSTFYSMVDFAQRMYPLLPVSLLLKHRFESAAKVRGLTLPYFAAHGQRDGMIPVSHTQRLAAAHGRAEAVTTCLYADADHNDFFDASGERLVREMGEFLGRVMA